MTSKTWPIRLLFHPRRPWGPVRSQTIFHHRMGKKKSPFGPTDFLIISHLSFLILVTYHPHLLLPKMTKLLRWKMMTKGWKWVWIPTTLDQVCLDEGWKMHFNLIFQFWLKNLDELKVNVHNNVLSVEAQHEEKSDDGVSRYVSRQFVRKYTLPEGCIPEQVTSNLSSDGVLIINAPKKTSGAITESGRSVPITMKNWMTFFYEFITFLIYLITKVDLKNKY